MAGQRKQPNSFLKPLLQDWYGKAEGDAAMLRHLPEPVRISESLDREMKRLLPPWEWNVIKVRQQWKEIAGAENARRCTPAFLNDGIFYIEVSHPAYRVVLETPQIKNPLQERIREIIGSQYCRSIRFIAGGRTVPRKK